MTYPIADSQITTINQLNNSTLQVQYQGHDYIQQLVEFGPETYNGLGYFLLPHHLIVKPEFVLPDKSHFLFNDYTHDLIEHQLPDIDFYDRLNILNSLAGMFAYFHRHDYSLFNIKISDIALICDDEGKKIIKFLGIPKLNLSPQSGSTDIVKFGELIPVFFPNSIEIHDNDILRDFDTRLYMIHPSLRKIYQATQAPQDNRPTFDDLLYLFSRIYTPFGLSPSNLIDCQETYTDFEKSKYYLKRHVLGYGVAKYMHQPSMHNYDLIYLLTKRPEYWEDKEQIYQCYKWLADIPKGFDYKSRAAFRYAMSILTDPSKIAHTEEGILYMKLASQMQYLPAMFEYGKLILKNYTPPPVDYMAAYSLFYECAHAGIDDAFYYLARSCDLAVGQPDLGLDLDKHVTAFYTFSQALGNERAPRRHADYLYLTKFVRSPGDNINQLKTQICSLYTQAIDMGDKKAAKLLLKRFGLENMNLYLSPRFFGAPQSYPFSLQSEHVVSAAMAGNHYGRALMASFQKSGALGIAQDTHRYQDTKQSIPDYTERILHVHKLSGQGFHK